MAIKTKLVSGGASYRLAASIGGSVASGLSAAGSSQSVAYGMSIDDTQVFTTVNSSTGCIFAQTYGPNDTVTIINAGAHALSIYPASGGKINGGSANAAYSLASDTAEQFVTPDGLNWWAI